MAISHPLHSLLRVIDAAGVRHVADDLSALERKLIYEQPTLPDRATVLRCHTLRQVIDELRALDRDRQPERVVAVE